ncbi:MAG TPA: flagellar brake protein [Paucimonas sp.]|nr:flagellar brake protein [Paucimonas sp.]
MDDAHEPASRVGRFRRYDFDSMHLQVGSRLQLTLYHGTKPAQYFTSLIGYVKDEYLLVKIPFDNGLPVSLLDGERLTVRAFSGTNVCTFFSTVERLFLKPLYYVHLAFPQMIEGTPLRQALRVKVNIPATLTSPTGGEASVVISNLSVAGALLEAEQELVEAHQAIELEFMLVAHLHESENVSIPVHAKATVRNVNLVHKANSPEDHDKYAYGVQFMELESSHRILLQNLAYEAMVEDRQRLV